MTEFVSDILNYLQNNENAQGVVVALAAFGVPLFSFLLYLSNTADQGGGDGKQSFGGISHGVYVFRVYYANNSPFQRCACS